MFESCLGEKDPGLYPDSRQLPQAQSDHVLCGRARQLSCTKQHSLPGIIKHVFVQRQN